MLKLHWDTLDSQTKEEILSNACIQERLQHYQWFEIDDWIKDIISSDMETRSHLAVTIVA